MVLPHFPSGKKLLGWVLVSLGLVGVVASLIIQKSEYDPASFTIGTISILMSIAGISLIMK